MSSFAELEQFGIYLARIHFQDKPEVYKVRPVLIVGTSNNLALALKMTSNLRQERVPAYVLEMWQDYGLNVPTSVLLSPLIALPVSDIYSEQPLGTLIENDTRHIVQALINQRS